MLKKLVCSFSRYIVSVQFRDHQLLGHFVPHILTGGLPLNPIGRFPSSFLPMMTTVTTYYRGLFTASELN